MRRPIATALAIALACGVVACGSDDGSDTDGAKATGTAKAAKPKPPPDVSATGDGVTPPGGGEKMLTDFGRAPTDAERAAIVATVDRYHAAVAADDDARICATMSRAGKRALTRNVGSGRSARCVDHVGVLYSGYTDAIRDSLDEARITEIRVKGTHALVIAIVPGPRTIKLPLDRERGIWRYGNFGKWASSL